MFVQSILAPEDVMEEKAAFMQLSIRSHTMMYVVLFLIGIHQLNTFVAISSPSKVLKHHYCFIQNTGLATKST